MRIRGKLTLTALKSVVRKMKNKDGKEIDVLIIPIEENNLFLSKKGSVYLDIIAFESDKIPDFTHSVKQSLPKEVREQLKADGIQTPFLGNLELMEAAGAAPQESSELPAEPEASDDGGDLPF